MVLWEGSELREGAAPQSRSWLVSQGIQVLNSEIWVSHELVEPSGGGFELFEAQLSTIPNL